MGFAPVREVIPVLRSNLRDSRGPTRGSQGPPPREGPDVVGTVRLVDGRPPWTHLVVTSPWTL